MGTLWAGKTIGARDLSSKCQRGDCREAASKGGAKSSRTAWQVQTTC